MQFAMPSGGPLSRSESFPASAISEPNHVEDGGRRWSCLTMSHDVSSSTRNVRKGCSKDVQGYGNPVAPWSQLMHAQPAVQGVPFVSICVLLRSTVGAKVYQNWRILGRELRRKGGIRRTEISWSFKTAPKKNCPIEGPGRFHVHNWHKSILSLQTCAETCWSTKIYEHIVECIMHRKSIYLCAACLWQPRKGHVKDGAEINNENGEHTNAPVSCLQAACCMWHHVTVVQRLQCSAQEPTHRQISWCRHVSSRIPHTTRRTGVSRSQVTKDEKSKRVRSTPNVVPKSFSSFVTSKRLASAFLVIVPKGRPRGDLHGAEPMQSKQWHDKRSSKQDKLIDHADAKKSSRQVLSDAIALERKEKALFALASCVSCIREFADLPICFLWLLVSEASGYNSLLQCGGPR